MDWNLLGIALLLTLAGLYFLETEKARALVDECAVPALKPARTALERAWQAEPVHIFMRQLLSARQRRALRWQMQAR
jgi:hypothetical protein